MARPPHALQLACVLLLLGGCVKSRESRDTGPDPQEYARVVCAYLSACGTEWLSQFPDGTEASCRDALACRPFGLGLPSPRECPAGAKELCELRGLYGAPCEPAQLPGDGEPCASGECQAGFTCEWGPCPTCRPAAAVGERCAFNARCEEGAELECESGRAFCDDDNTCRPLGRDGDACRSFLECDGRSCVDGVCAPPRGKGEACEGPFDCQQYLTCRDGTCTEKRGEGEACGGDWPQCQPGLICAGSVCTKGLCTGEAAEVGTPCLAGECGEQGLYCDRDTGRCARVLELGAPCDLETGAACGRGAFCSPEGRCEAARGEGESCNQGACRAGLVCVPDGCDLTCGCTIGDDTPFTCKRLDLAASCE